MSSPNAAAASRLAPAIASDQVVLGTNYPHPLAPTTGACLDQHRIPDLLGCGYDRIIVEPGEVDAGEGRELLPSRTSVFEASFDPMTSMASAGGPDPDQACVDHSPGEVGILGEEPVAGVDGVGAGLLGCPQDGVDVEIGVDRGRPRQISPRDRLPRHGARRGPNPSRPPPSLSSCHDRCGTRVGRSRLGWPPGLSGSSVGRG